MDWPCWELFKQKTFVFYGSTLRESFRQWKMGMKEKKGDNSATKFWFTLWL